MDYYNKIARYIRDAYVDDDIDDLLYIAHCLNANIDRDPLIQEKVLRQLHQRFQVE